MALKHDYDDVADMLYLSPGEGAQLTVNMTLDEHIVLRLDKDTHRGVGLMVHDVSALIAGHIDETTLPVIADTFRVVIDSINALRDRPDARAFLLAG